MFFIQHDSGGGQLFREGADPAHLVLLDGRRSHGQGGLADLDNEMMKAIGLVVA